MIGDARAASAELGAALFERLETAVGSIVAREADEIADIVAFLKTLKTPAKFKDPLDDPEQRPKPVEDRAALDPFVNPAAEHIDTGAALFKKSCANCHADPKASFRRWAVEMPKWEPRLNKVLGAEEFIARHAKATTGADLPMESQTNIDLSIYLHSLANGETIKVDLSSPGAKAAYERGVALADLKIGQFNFSCNDCHQKSAGKWKAVVIGSYERGDRAVTVQKLAEHAGLKAHAVRYALQAMIDRKAIEPMPPPPNGVHRGDVPPNVKREA